MTCHYPDLGGVSDWSGCVGNLIQPIRSISVSQTSFRRETSGSFAKCRLFSQAKHVPESKTCPGCLWILECGFGFGKVFWILGSVSGFWDVFWILGKCFWILGCVLDSGKCFWILGRVLDSGKCFRATVALKSPTRQFTHWELFAVKCAVVTFSSDCSKFLYCWLWLHHTQTSIVKTFSAWFTKTSWFLMFYIF